MSTSTEDWDWQDNPPLREYRILNRRTGSISTCSHSGSSDIVINEDLYWRLKSILESEREKHCRENPDYEYALQCNQKSNSSGGSLGYADEDEASRYRCRKTGHIVTVRPSDWNYEEIAHSSDYRPYPCEFDIYLEHGEDVEKQLGIK